MVDKAVFLELRNSASLNVLLVLLGLYFTFNLSCNKLQELIFQFVEECVSHYCRSSTS